MFVTPKFKDVAPIKSEVGPYDNSVPLAAGAFGCALKNENSVVKIQLQHLYQTNAFELPNVAKEEFTISHLISNLKNEDPFVVKIFSNYQVEFNDENAKKVEMIVGKNDKCIKLKNTIKETNEVLEKLKHDSESPEAFESARKEVERGLKYIKENNIPLTEENYKSIESEPNPLAQHGLMLQYWSGAMASIPSGPQKDEIRKVKSTFQDLNPNPLEEEGLLPTWMVTEMEYANSSDLLRMMQSMKRELNVDELSSLYFQMLYSLYGIQRRYPILHKDIKPENFLLDIQPNDRIYNLSIGDGKVFELRNFVIPAGTPQVLLADYGLATISVSSNWMDGTNGWVNPMTMFYSTPETSPVALPSRAPDSDTWALGMVFWIVAAHNVLYGSNNTFKVTSPVDLVEEKNGKIDPKLEKLANQALDLYYGKDPNTKRDRWDVKGVATAMGICYIMKAIGHSFLPPTSISFDRLPDQKTFKYTNKGTREREQIGLFFNENETEICQIIDSRLGAKNAGSEISDKIKSKIGSDLWTVIQKSTRWESDDRSFRDPTFKSSQYWDQGKFLESLLTTDFSSTIPINNDNNNGYNVDTLDEDLAGLTIHPKEPTFRQPSKRVEPEPVIQKTPSVRTPSIRASSIRASSIRTNQPIQSEPMQKTPSVRTPTIRAPSNRTNDTLSNSLSNLSLSDVKIAFQESPSKFKDGIPLFFQFPI